MRDTLRQSNMAGSKSVLWILNVEIIKFNAEISSASHVTGGWIKRFLSGEATLIEVAQVGNQNSWRKKLIEFWELPFSRLDAAKNCEQWPLHRADNPWSTDVACDKLQENMWLSSGTHVCIYIYQYNDPPAIVLAMSSQQLLPPQLGPIPSCKLLNLPRGRCDWCGKWGSSPWFFWETRKWMEILWNICPLVI